MQLSIRPQGETDALLSPAPGNSSQPQRRIHERAVAQCALLVAAHFAAEQKKEQQTKGDQTPGWTGGTLPASSGDDEAAGDEVSQAAALAAGDAPGAAASKADESVDVPLLALAQRLADQGGTPLPVTFGGSVPLTSLSAMPSAGAAGPTTPFYDRSSEQDNTYEVVNPYLVMQQTVRSFGISQIEEVDSSARAFARSALSCAPLMLI